MTTDEAECTRCPQCESDDITYAGGFECGSIDVRCIHCDAHWYEVWRYCHIEMITGEDKR